MALRSATGSRGLKQLFSKTRNVISIRPMSVQVSQHQDIPQFGFSLQVINRCRAGNGPVSNPTHVARKLRKAGQSRWLGRRLVVRGVAMNPVDHHHGGGEGRSKSSGGFGRTSRTPWGKPKSGYETGPLKRKK